ncbi:hypothetical protein H9P43_007790 [Blastocladiella emersonii ATCC 22665]|nr:hypothetical protein H9P43_007790 [Blastocladiella emersonii ATCC 22665]
MLLSFPQVLSSTLEFLEAAIHVVLHARRLYPPHIFGDAQIYGVAVKACRSPAVIRYVRSVLEPLRPALEAMTIESVSLLVVNPDVPGEPLERIVFRVRPTIDLLLGLRSGTPHRDLTAPITLASLETEFKATLLRLQTIGPTEFSAPDRSDCTFVVAADLTTEAFRKLQQAKPGEVVAPLGDMWIPGGSEVPDLQAIKESRPVGLVAFKTVDASLLTIETFAEDYTRAPR